MKDKGTPTSIRLKLHEHLQSVAQQLPDSLMANDPHLNAHNVHLLGTETCLITSDGMALLRRRGGHVLTGKHKWDVAVSGYSGREDMAGIYLDLAHTIMREAQNELGDIAGDPQKITFLGVHRNKINGAIDVLAVWPIADTADHISELITTVNPQKETTFLTVHRATEPYVWDTHNLLVQFDGLTILRSFQRANISLSDFMPEALVCLELALDATSQRLLGLGL
jgi:hypothetical protein